MSKEIFDLESAILKDKIEPLFEYRFGSIVLAIFPSSALTGEDSFLYVKSQLFAAAVATEYEELRKKSEELIEQQKTSGMSRELAQEYTDVMQQLSEKSIELDSWTLKYVASLTKSNPDEFASKMQTEIDIINEKTQGDITLSTLINALYQKIIKEMQTITVESQEEQDAKMYEVVETPVLEGKQQDSEPSTAIDNTASGS